MQTWPVHYGSFLKPSSSHLKKNVRSTMLPSLPSSYDISRHHQQCRNQTVWMGHKPKILPTISTMSYPHLCQPSQTKLHSMEWLHQASPATSFYRWYKQQATTTSWKLVPRSDFSSMEPSCLPSRPQDLLIWNRTLLYGTSLWMTVNPPILSMVLSAIITIDFSNRCCSNIR
jgi:hypothetical protein